MNKLKSAALALALGLALPFQAHASLIGDSVTIGGSYTATSPTAIVGAGSESLLFIAIGGGVVINLFSVDVNANSVTWTSQNTILPGGGGSPILLTLGDLDFAGFPGGIVGVGFAVAGVTGLDAADISFGADSLSVDVQSADWPQFSTLTVTFRLADVAPVPEPGALSLAALAVAGLWLSRRRSVVPAPHA